MNKKCEHLNRVGEAHIYRCMDCDEVINPCDCITQAFQEVEDIIERYDKFITPEVRAFRVHLYNEIQKEKMKNG